MTKYRPALFLDRDGIVNEDRDFVHRREDFHWQDGIFDLVRSAVARCMVPVVVTNQSGIGRGYYSDDAFQELTAWMCERFAAEGAPIARVYHCPFLPDAPLAQYRGDHAWRKPRPGMLLAAAADLGLALDRSIMLGDRWSDMQAAATAGLATGVIVGDASGRPAPAALAAGTRIVRQPSVRAAADWLATTLAAETA